MNTKFKTLYHYEVLVPQEVEERTPIINDAGQEAIQIIKVTKEVPKKCCLKKPSRALLDEAELYYNVLVGKGIQAGLISRAILAKKFNNEGGVMSDPEKKAYSKAYYELEQKERQHQITSMKEESLMSAAEKQKFKKLVEDIGLLKRQLQDFEAAQLSLFDITAETRARTKTILWWVLWLTHIENPEREDGWEPLFKGDSLEEKMDSYDTIEEAEGLDDQTKTFYFKAIRRAAAATAFWFYGQASRQEDFEALEKEINRDTTEEKIEEPVVETPETPSEPSEGTEEIQAEETEEVTEAVPNETE